MTGKKIHLMVLGVSCFDGMAATGRIRNLLDPVMEEGLLTASNLIYQRDIESLEEPSGVIDGIGYREIDYCIRNPFSFIKFVKQGKRYLEETRDSGLKNILYNYGGPSIVNIAFIRHARRLGYSVLGDIVEDNRFEQITHFAYRIKILSSVFLLKRAWRFSNGLTGISNHLYNRLQVLMDGRVPVYHLPVSVDLNKIAPTGLRQGGKDINMFYGGSMTERDGLAYLIPAFDRVAEKNPHLRLVLCGAGTNADIRQVKQLIGRARNCERIDYKGYVTSSEYHTLLKNSDILCMMRIDSEYAHAGFPFKLAEYLAAGKCILATRVGDVPLYLSHGENAILVDPGSTGQIVSALEEITSDPAKAEALGKRARITAEKHFSAESVSRQFYSILNAL